MKKDGKYRFSLQFPETTEENKRVGELLERLGNRKSELIVSAMNEYIENHPELQNEDCKLQITVTPTVMPGYLEELVRNMIEKRMSEVQSVMVESPKIPVSVEHKEKNITFMENTDSLEEDVSQMLDNLDFFQ